MGERRVVLEAQGEQLLQNLINREQTLAAKVEEARKEADSLIEQARAEAAGLMQKAQADAEALQSRLRQDAEKQAETIREETVAAARSDADALSGKAEGAKAEALKIVMERILS